MPRSKMYRCPYDKSTECSKFFPCSECEDYAAYLGMTGKTVKASTPVQHAKGAIPGNR